MLRPVILPARPAVRAPGPAATVGTELAHVVRGGLNGRGAFPADQARVHGVGLQPGNLGSADLGRAEGPALRARDAVLLAAQPVLYDMDGQDGASGKPCP